MFARGTAGTAIMGLVQMENFTFNFCDADHIKVDFADSGKTIFIGGRLESNNRTFFASTNDLRRCSFLSYDEQDELARALSHRTHNDRLQILFDW